jgi:hypothetical protein
MCVETRILAKSPVQTKWTLFPLKIQVKYLGEMCVEMCILGKRPWWFPLYPLGGRVVYAGKGGAVLSNPQSAVVVEYSVLSTVVFYTERLGVDGHHGLG